MPCDGRIAELDVSVPQNTVVVRCDAGKPVATWSFDKQDFRVAIDDAAWIRFWHELDKVDWRAAPKRCKRPSADPVVSIDIAVAGKQRSLVCYGEKLPRPYAQLVEAFAPFRVRLVAERRRVNRSRAN